MTPAEKLDAAIREWREAETEEDRAAAEKRLDALITECKLAGCKTCARLRESMQ